MDEGLSQPGSHPVVLNMGPLDWESSASTTRSLLLKKIRLILKSMTSQTGYQINTTHIFTNISRNKDNQAMKLGQLLKYNMRNTFLEKSYTKCGRETTPRPFSKKLKVRLSNGLLV